jgi:hypothetical protein
MLMRFQTGLADSYLTKEQIQSVCPVAFKTTPTSNKVSSKYSMVNTETVIDDLEKLGWLPVQAAQRKSRGKETIFSKHMISFQNPDIKIKGKNGDDAYPRIILTNSHDGFNSFQFRVGIFRLVCSNGLVVADENFSSFKIRHTGYTFEELRTIMNQVVEDLPNKIQVLNKMQARILTPQEMRDLATKAMQIRTEKLDAEFDDSTIVDILTPTRKEDEGEDLWTVFNVLQEKITQGGYSSALKGAKIRKVRKIKSFEKDLRVNQELFKLAAEMVS